MTPLLEVIDVSKRFAGLTALSGISFSVNAGEIFGIIGPNGAGKTTLFNTITQTLKASSGTFRLNGQLVAGGPAAAARQGIVRTFQSATIFKEASVADNVRRAWYLRHYHQPGRLLARGGKADELQSVVDGVLSFLNLDQVAERRAGELSYGLQKLLGIALALAVEPKLMLMDEPAAGLNSTEKRRLGRLLEDLRGRGMTIIVVEHDVPLIMSCCDRVLVLNYGQAIALGTPAEIRDNQLVEDAYLGGSHEPA